MGQKSVAVVFPPRLRGEQAPGWHRGLIQPGDSPHGTATRPGSAVPLLPRALNVKANEVLKRLYCFL